MRATVRELVRGWPALGAALAAAAGAFFVSALAAQSLGLIFHFHPAAILAGGAWLYRRLEGERPCTTRSVAYLVGALALVGAYQDALEPRGLADPGPVTLVIALIGLAAAAWILLRQGPQPAAT